MFIFFGIASFAKSIYIDSNKGNDNNDGKSDKTALATIKKAMTIAESGDNIFIEGNNGKNIYNDNFDFNSELSNISIIGKNNPVLDGKGLNTPAGIIINSQTVTIKGLKIINFNSGNLNVGSLKSSAAIFVAEGMRDIVIEDNEFENNNYGVIFHSAEFCSIKNNIINSAVSKNNSDIFSGGIGILLYSTGKFLQKNLIESNTIKNTDYAGIMMYGATNNVDAEFTQINSNKITNSKKYGLYFHNLVNTVNVQSNFLSANHTNLFMSGTCYDMLIENNIFETALSGTELESSESYFGDMLFVIWQSYGNKFQGKTYAYCKKNEMYIELTNGSRKVLNKPITENPELNKDQFEIVVLEAK